MRYLMRSPFGLHAFMLEDRVTPSSAGGTVAAGDVNGDGYSDIAVGTAPGEPAKVRVINGFDGSVMHEFGPYVDTPFGVNVALGDIDGNGSSDIITAPGVGGGPHVRVFDGVSGEEMASFYAFDDGFRGGVWVGTGDMDADGKADIYTGAGAGGGPHVRVFNVADRTVMFNEFVYESQFTGGVRVAGGDVNGDGRADVLAAPGEGGGPRVRAYSGVNGVVLHDFFAADRASGAVCRSRPGRLPVTATRILWWAVGRGLYGTCI